MNGLTFQAIPTLEQYHKSLVLKRYRHPERWIALHIFMYNLRVSPKDRRSEHSSFNRPQTSVLTSPRFPVNNVSCCATTARPTQPSGRYQSQASAPTPCPIRSDALTTSQIVYWLQNSKGTTAPDVPPTYLLCWHPHHNAASKFKNLLTTEPGLM